MQRWIYRSDKVVIGDIGWLWFIDGFFESATVEQLLGFESWMMWWPGLIHEANVTLAYIYGSKMKLRIVDWKRWHGNDENLTKRFLILSASTEAPFELTDLWDGDKYTYENVKVNLWSVFGQGTSWKGEVFSWHLRASLHHERPAEGGRTVEGGESAAKRCNFIILDRFWISTGHLVAFS